MFRGDVRFCVAIMISALLHTAVLQTALFAQTQPPRSSALSPAESLASIELDAGFEIKVIAHEPQVIDPVDAAFDARGRLWVVEMRDYPYPTSESPAGRIRILTDADGDANFESSVVFADQLDMPTGIALWKDGAVVTLAGQVVWFRDTDDDAKADTQQVWIEGFSRENEQLRANHPRLGPDGWWYIASGLRGGNVIAGPDFRSATDQPLTLGSRDVRFHPQLRKLEAITGPAQFGLCFDSIGNRIFCSNRNPAVMVRFEQSDLLGNPLAGLIPSVVDLIPAGEQSQVFPLVNAWTTSNLHSGQFTAACGVLWHPFPQPNSSDHSRIFTCEPTGSLVHASSFTSDSPHAASSLQPSAPLPGARESRPLPPSSQVSSSQPQNKEWLASRDPWFRPVNVTSAPGGVLVIDMHRAVIEHPQWVPDELKKRVDERWGNDCGRIFLVSEKTTATSPQTLQPNQRPLAEQNESELLQSLNSTDPWTRDTARRLLIERDSTQLTAIHSIASNRQLPAATRIAALHLADATLQPALAQSPVERAEIASLHSQYNFLRDLISTAETNAEVRRAALRSASAIPAELQGATETDRLQIVQLETSLLEAVMQCAAEGDQQLLIEALRCIASRKTPPTDAAEKMLLQQITKHIAQPALPETQEKEVSTPELLVVAASALRSKPELLIAALLDALRSREDTGEFTETYATAAQRLTIAALEQQSDMKFAAFFLAASQALGAPQNLNPDLKRDLPKQSAATAPALAMLHELILRANAKPTSTSPNPNAIPLETPLWNLIRKLINTPDSTIAVRRRAIAVLALSPNEQDKELLRQSAQSGDLPLRTAALRAWSTTDDEACDAYLLKELSNSSPQLQQVIVELIAQRPARLASLAARLADGTLSAKRIGAIELKKLAQRAKGDVQQQLNAALATIENSDRAKVVADYQTSLTMAADPQLGKEIFAKHCASCHRIDNVGVQVGPDISDSRTQQPTQLLTNILDPNRVIDNNYFRFVALTIDDQVVEGMIAEETSESIVLRGQNNSRTVLKRAELQDLKATGISLMPEGLEAQIDPTAMAHLISYIKNWRYQN